MNALQFTTTGFLLISITAGCQEQPDPPLESAFSEDRSSATDEVKAAPQVDGVRPSESASQAVVESKPLPPVAWAQTEIEDAGYVLSLGYRCDSLNPGEILFPTVSVQKDGRQISACQIHVCLVAADGTTELTEPCPGRPVVEPHDERGHFTTESILLPQGAPLFLIRYRIQLPGVEAESWYDVELTTN